MYVTVIRFIFVDAVAEQSLPRALEEMNMEKLVLPLANPTEDSTEVDGQDVPSTDPYIAVAMLIALPVGQVAVNVEVSKASTISTSAGLIYCNILYCTDFFGFRFTCR